MDHIFARSFWRPLQKRKGRHAIVSRPKSMHKGVWPIFLWHFTMLPFSIFLQTRFFMSFLVSSYVFLWGYSSSRSRSEGAVQWDEIFLSRDGLSVSRSSTKQRGIEYVEQKLSRKSGVGVLLTDHTSSQNEANNHDSTNL